MRIERRGGAFSKRSTPENDCLTGYLDGIDREFVERVATPKLLMQLGLQLHCPEMSILNTVSIIGYSISFAFSPPLTTGFTGPI